MERQYLPDNKSSEVHCSGYEVFLLYSYGSRQLHQLHFASWEAEGNVGDSGPNSLTLLLNIPHRWLPNWMFFSLLWASGRSFSPNIMPMCGGIVLLFSELFVQDTLFRWLRSRVFETTVLVKRIGRWATYSPLSGHAFTASLFQVLPRWATATLRNRRVGLFFRGL